MAARLPWFLAGEPDVLGLLDEQAQVTVAGMRAFASWSSGGDHDAQEVRDCEHRADDARRALAEALRTVLVCPLEPEDVYTMSERLDVVVNGATGNPAAWASMAAMPKHSDGSPTRPPPQWRSSS